MRGENFLALSLARLGSQRVKHKNILKIYNKTLLDFTFAAGIKSKYLKEIFLSSESKKIINIGKKIGFKIPFIRPKKLSKNDTSSESVILHALKFIKKKYEYIIVLQPTSPLRTANDIDKAIEIFLKKKYDSLVSVSVSNKVHKFNLKKRGDFIERDFKNTKVKKKNFYINGAIYITKIKYFLKHKGFFNSKTGYYLMKKKNSLDIDDNIDLQKLRKIIKKNDKKN